MSTSEQLTDRSPRTNRTAPVVMLHSAFFNGSQFDALRPHFGGRALYSPSYRGQNGIPHGGTTISMELLAEDLVADIRRRFQEPVHLIGNSMGGFVAVHACAHAPDLFRSVTLLATTCAPEPDLARFAEFESNMLALGPVDMAPRVAQMMFGASFLREKPDEVAAWTAVFARVAPSIVDTMRAIYQRSDMRDLLPRITAPMLLLSGAEDRVRKPEEMAEIAIRKPGALFCNVACAGHTLALEQPEAVAAILNAWWDSL